MEEQYRSDLSSTIQVYLMVIHTVFIAHHSSGTYIHKATSPSTCASWKNTSELFVIRNSNRNPLATTCLSVLQIDYLTNPELSPAENIICMNFYQRLFWRLTCPYLTPFMAFLLAYNHHPSPNHLKVEIYSLW